MANATHLAQMSRFLAIQDNHKKFDPANCINIVASRRQSKKKKGAACTAAHSGSPRLQLSCAGTSCLPRVKSLACLLTYMYS